jgi:subtilase family serine protease
MEPEPFLTEPTVAPPSSTAALGYSLTPSSTEPSAVCPPPAPGNAGCLSILDPQPVKTASGYKADSAGPLLEGGGEGGGFAPKELQEAYKIPTTGGSTQTVAIVDAYDDPNAEADLQKYREKYKLDYKSGEPACTKANGCFKKVNQEGKEEKYPTDKYPVIPDDENYVEDWGLEMSLDLDMVSAACPECKIILVEATNRETSNLYAAESEAVALESGGKKLATEVSNSWGGAEYSEETTKDTDFNHPDIPTTASAGDSGYGVSYPAASKDVISVGGTTLKKKTGSERGWEETVWVGTGSGCSAYEAKPEWQHDPGCTKRTDNDVAAVANYEESPVSVYDSYEYEAGAEGRTGKLGWVLVGGTSVASPLVAGIEAHASTTVKDEGAEAFYRHSLFDVTSGSNGKCGNYLCEAEEGYDGSTGWGTPDGPLELTPKLLPLRRRQQA